MSLLEATFATAILSVTLVSVIGGVLSAYEANAITRQRVVALDSARSLLDEIRTSRNEGLKLASSINQLRELFSTDPQKLLNPLLKDGTRTLSINSTLSGLVNLDVEVGWTDLRGRKSQVVLSTALSNYE